MSKSRIKNTLKNTGYGYVSSIVSMILRFVSRTIFIKTLGATYLGVDGLFTNVLGVLSFAELGIGTAMNYNLYRPIAENDKEKIKSLMNLYKNSYRIIAAIIAVIGLCLVPFLKYIVKDPGNVGNITVYYLIFLFNTVITYLVSYKFSLVNAEQKNYIFTNINMLTTCITTVCQMISLLIFKNFLLYLLIASFIGLIQKIFINLYLNKIYPYLLDKNTKPLDHPTKKSIFENVKALILHKLGEVSIHQTDNIIISTFINITTVGLVSNYSLILTMIKTFLNMAFSNTLPSLGNLVATTDLKKQFSIFKIYNFVNFWMFGFCSIAFIVLASPFISLWIGADKIISNSALILIVIDFYFLGQRTAFLNYKTAFGVFYDDKFVVLQSAIINLVVSIVGAKYMGIVGVYLGTVISGLYQSIRRPIIAYSRITGDKTVNYFKMLLKYFICVLVPGSILYIAALKFLAEVTVLKFIFMAIVVAVVVNFWFYFLFRKSDEFNYLKNVVLSLLKKFKGGVKTDE